MILLLELIGTVAFALSGANEAIYQKMDLFGVCMLAIVTSVGGGCIRDMILGVTPPSLFVHPVYVSMALVVAILLFVLVKVTHRDVVDDKKLHNVIVLMDTIGLATFTVVGIDTGIEAGYQGYSLFLVFLGVITGVGGGVLRDMLAVQIPAIFRKHIYGVAAIIGAIIAVNLYPLLNDTALLIGAGVITVIRILASHYKWNLPKANE